MENSGEATFEPTPGEPGCTTVNLRLSYTLPDIAGPLVESSLAQKFVRSTLLGTMKRFQLALEGEAATARETAEVIIS